MTKVINPTMYGIKRAAVVVDEWDDLDPVANALLALIEAQNDVGRTITAMIDDGTCTDAEVDAALVARSDAVVNLLAAQTEYWRQRDECVRGALA